MKSVAFGFIILSAISFGFELLMPQKRRIEVLESLCRALEVMHAELSCRPCSMLELLEKMRNDNVGQVKDFFNSMLNSMSKLGDECFSKIWDEAVREKLGCLSCDQLKIFARLGSTLGVFSLSEQLNSISRCGQQLHQELNSMKAAYPTNRKLCIGLPCSIGAMLIIVLI